MSVLEYPGRAGSFEAGGLRTLYQLLTALSRANALEDVYSAALASLLEATAADRAAILLFDDEDVIRFKAARGISVAYQRAVTGHSPWPRGARNASPVLVPDVLKDASLSPFRDAFAKEGIRALAFIPLALDAGVFGKFMLYYSEPHEIGVEELEIAQAIAAHVALAADRKRAEFARVASEQRLQAILDNSPAVIFLKDLQGRYLLANRRCEELIGLTGANMAGLTDHDLFDPALADTLRANDHAVLLAGKPIALEEYVPQDDGIHTYLSVKFPVEEANGAIAGVCGIATDITERKQLEAASQRLAAIVESSDDAVISKDLNGIVTSWNSAAGRIFLYTEGEVLGGPISILADPDRPDEMPAILSRIKRGERVEHYETRRRRKDGVVIDVALTVSPVRDASGRIIGASKIARDITERRRRERERISLLEREKEARRTAELLNQVGPRLAAQLDLEKLVQEITDIATSLVGARFGAFCHNPASEKGESPLLYSISGVPCESFEAVARDIEALAPTLRGGGVVRCDDVTLDPRYIEEKPDGSVPADTLRVRSYLAMPVLAWSGEVLGGLVFGHELPGRFTKTHEEIITGIAAQAAIAMDNARLFEQNQWARTELTRANEELRRANSDLELFAYSASHDLQEPVRNIALSAQLLERNWANRLQGEDETFLSNILGASKRMGVLIQDLLAYTNATKYEEGPPPSVDPAQVLAEVLQNLQAPLKESGVAVSAGPMPAVAIHASRLAQLFLNLIGNAVKYRNTTGDPYVHVECDERDGWCVFSVRDNGIGIDPQYADQIFGLFKRLHGREKYPGSGIGLAICQRIVEQYGGRIWLERSAPDKGSTFCSSIASRG